jgi:hypothetical protein
MGALVMGTGCLADDADVDENEEEAVAETSDALKSQRVKPPGFKYPFDNWDHDGARVDHPVSIIFVSRRPDLVDRVYDQVGSVGLTGGGGKMTLSGIGGSRPGVDPDEPWTSRSAGRKGAFGCWGKCDRETNIHMRTYGPDGRQGTQIYQGSSGVRPYYLLATTHFDVRENTSREDFGYQDRARSLLVGKLVGAGKWRVLQSVDVKNACDRRLDKKHLCKHDGKALVIDID